VILRAGDELLSAIREVSERDDAVTREALYEALLDANLVLPAKQGADEGHLFTTPPAEDGSWKLLAFTDADAAAAWRAEGVDLTTRPARDVFAAAVTSPTSAILLNVAGPAGGELTRREFTALAEGSMPSGDGEDVEEVHLAPGSEVFVTTPARPPGAAFLGVLRMALDESAPVRAAWLADVAFAAGELHPAVGVALEPGTGEDELRAVFDLVMGRIQPLLGHGRYLDFIVIDEVWGPLFADAGPPIFDREAA
jgi:hypothetical protein